MGYFPLCINLDNTSVVLVGEGKLTREKLEILLSFGADIRLFSLHGFDDRKEQPNISLQRKKLTCDDLQFRPMFIVVGDVEYEEKLRISTMAQEMHIPVNVVDTPALCTFYFPALITKGNLTVAVSTSGKSPGAAAYLKRRLEAQIPDQSDEILEWLCDVRQQLYRKYPENNHRSALREITALAFEQNRPLCQEELEAIIHRNDSQPEQL